MRNIHKNTSQWTRINRHLRYIMSVIALCAAIYYLPAIAGVAGWISTQNSLNRLHNFYGIDFLGLTFFAPVLYTAYVLGVIPSVMTAFISMFILLPYSILIDTYPDALFKPSAFVIILSTVGTAVAMLQKSEQQQRQRIKEMKCLYDIGKATQESHSIDAFLSKVVELILQVMPYSETTNVMITFRDRVYQSPNFHKTAGKITETLAVGGESLGNVEIYSTRDNPYLKKKSHLTKTLVERIDSALRELELQQSLHGYYEQLEKEVDNRTKDLEQVQEKLIRSERLAAVGELASGVGHELRNPLNVIRNCAYLLNMSLSDKGDAEAMNTLKFLDKQIDIANKIVTDLLDFTRIRPPSPVIVDLSNLIKESLSWVAVPESVLVNSHLNNNSFQIRIDPEQISRVFTNIISNAVQAMNGKGELTIDTGVKDSQVWVKFKDTGCGIPEENIGKIFEPLFTTKPKGIGLGLAISKRLAEQNRGKIEVASQVGKGATFTVKLPNEKRS